MAMPALPAEWTVDMLDALPDDDGQRYEIIDGELFVTPAPREIHQLVVGHMYYVLKAYLRGSSVGRVIGSPSDVRRGDRTRNRVQMVFFQRAQIRVLDELADDLAADLLAVVALENGARHVTGSEPLDTGALLQAAVRLLDLGADFLGWKRNADLFLDRAQVLDGDLHGHTTFSSHLTGSHLL